MEETVKISKKEYFLLRRQAQAYKKLTSRLFDSVLKNPINEVIDDFRKTNLYTEEFLNDLEDGLKKSSYAKK